MKSVIETLFTKIHYLKITLKVSKGVALPNEKMTKDLNDELTEHETALNIIKNKQDEFLKLKDN